MMDLAYKPTSSLENSKEIIAPTKIDIPSYPDQGVAFAGFSKTLISGNQFKLNPQERWSYTMDWASFVGILIEGTDFPPVGKKLYISSLQLNTSISAVDANSYVRLVSDNGPVSRVIFQTGLIRSETFSCIFNPPLEFTDPRHPNVFFDGLQIHLSSGLATMNRATINLQGWLE